MELHFKRITLKPKTKSAPTPTATTSSVAMDIDPLESPEATPSPLPARKPKYQLPKELTPEMEAKLEQMIKKQVSLKNICNKAEEENKLRDLRLLLSEAQENQKKLQKLITKEDIQSYVKGWNTWEEKRRLFPSNNQVRGAQGSSRNNQGKHPTPRNRNHLGMHNPYDNPERWNRLAHLMQAAKGMFDSNL